MSKQTKSITDFSAGLNAGIAFKLYSNLKVCHTERTFKNFTNIVNFKMDVWLKLLKIFLIIFFIY